MPFNQMFTGRSLPLVAQRCSFTDVYLGGDAGYVQVTRTTGDGPVLLVLPLQRDSLSADVFLRKEVRPTFGPNNNIALGVEEVSVLQMFSQELTV